MPIVTLAPRTKRGKQLIKNNGPRWEILWESDYAIALHGPGIFIQSIVDDKEQRWIGTNGKPHFYVKKKKGSR